MPSKAKFFPVHCSGDALHIRSIACNLWALSLTLANLQGSVGEVERFLEAQGLNARALLDGARQATATAGDALETARPTVDSTVSNVSSTLLSTDPVVLAEYAAGLVALYYLVRLPWGSEQLGGSRAKGNANNEGSCSVADPLPLSFMCCCIRRGFYICLGHTRPFQVVDAAENFVMLHSAL